MRKFLLIFSYLPFVCLILWIMTGSLYAQNGKIKGKITDSETGDALPFVNISIKDATGGTASNMEGFYTLDIKPGLHTVNFTAVSFQKVTRIVEVKPNATITLNIEMMKQAKELDVMVISSSKYEQRQQELTTTVEVLKPTLIENKNTVTIDKVVEQTPGVAIIDNEPQIRGGSGFSSGLGSRVMILVDDMPLMRVDAGRPVWPFIPIENVEQIEVLKGASSVLYGSSALNGAINVRTAYAKSKPETKINVFGGVYSAPNNKNQKYWSGFNPFFTGMSVLHARKLTSQLDLVVGGNFYWDQGFVGPELPKSVPGYNLTLSQKNLGEYDKRGRVNFALRYRPKKSGFTFGLAGNIMYQEQADANFWYNDTSGFYNAFPGSLINFTNLMFYIDPYVNYYNKSGDKHTLRSRYFYSDNKSDKGQNTISHNIFGEYQYQRLFKKLNFNLITGLMMQYTNANSLIFVGLPNGGNRSYQTNMSLYLQLEKKLFKRLSLQGGARFEYFEINGLTNGRPVFRAGANFTVIEGTYLRGSWGQGYRFPSIGERYIVTNVGGFGFYPNPGLKPEKSWNAEFGIKQMFRIANFGGFIDLAGFWQEYKDFVEFYTGLWGTSSNPFQNLGFKFVNTGRARVPGAEVTIAGQGKIHKNLEIQLLAGYMYSHPITLSPNQVVGEFIALNGIDTIKATYQNSSSITNNGDSTSRILKYRIQHLAKADIQFNIGNFIKKGLKQIEFGLGGSARYYSNMQNIDQFFYNLDNLFGAKNYRENNSGNVWVFDARVSVEFRKRLKANLIMNNLLNTAYVLRPMNAEAPRSTQLQISYKL